MKKINFKTLLLAIGLVVASTQPAWAVWKIAGVGLGGNDWSTHDCDNNGNVTLTNVEAGWHDFKIIDGDNWSGNNFGVKRSGSVIGDGTNGGNRTFNLSIKSNISVNIYDWTATMVGTPAVDKYVTGTINSWSATSWKMSYDADNYCFTYTATNITPGTYTFRIHDGKWSTDTGWDQYDASGSSGVSASSAGSDNNISLIVNGTGGQDVTFKLYVNKSLTVCVEAQPSVNAIVGTFNSWDGTQNPLNYTDNVAQTTIALTSGTTYKFKVRVNSDWRGNNGTMNRKNCTDWDMSTNVGDECKITADLTGNYIFIYNKSTGKLTVKYPSTLTLDGNDGTPATQNLTLYIGDEMSSTKFTQPERTGYDYKSFTTEKNGSTNLINQDGTFASSGTYTSSKTWSYVNGTGKTVYAKWEPHKYSITYKDKGGSVYSGTKTGLVTTHTYATATNLVDGYGKKGYTFIGWYTSSDCSGDAISTLGATDFSENITLYAKWQANTTNITINKNDGTGGTVAVSAVYDGAISAVTGLTDALRTRIGYTFSEINTTAKGSGTTIITWTGSAWAFAANAGSGTYTDNTPVWKYTENTDLTLNTRWTANPYTVSFYDADDAASPSQTLNVTYDAEIGSSSVTKPTKSGYIFGGYFTGKGGTGTQLTDANGNLLEVAGYFEKQSTKLYWKHADNVTAYAAWSEEKTCSLTFGITDGAQATNERGSLSITFNETEYKVGGLTGGNPSTATINGIPSGTELTINHTKRTGSGVDATTPESWWTTVTKTSSAPVTYQSAGVYSFVVTDDASIYLWSTLNEYEFGHSVEPAAGGEITTDNGTFIAGPAVQRILTATPNDGYEFSSWTLSSGNVVPAGSQTTTTNPLTITLKNSSNESVTANFTPITYTITYNGVESIEHTNPATYTIETATITLQDASRTNYTFDGWFDNENLTGDPITSIPQGTTGDKVYWAKWHETLHSVNIVANTGIESTTPQGATNVGNVTPVQISATVKAGYTWKNWTTDNSSHVTFANANANPTTITATGGTNVYANATEILLPLTTSVNEEHMGSMEKTASSIGVATTSQLTATAANRNYKFKQWNLTNCTITSGTINDATITINGDGINTPSAEAEFEVAWYVNGDDVFSGWGTNGHQMTEQSEGVFAVTINVTQIASQSTDFGCKIYNASQGWYYEYNNTEGDGWWFTRENPSTTIGRNSKTNMRLRSDMVGNYIFTLDCSTSRENPTLTVTFPTSTTYDVDIYYDGVTKTTIEGGEFAKSITANVPESMRFDQWVVEGETSHVNIDDVNSQTTTFTASGEGAIIRAKFKVVGVMYLKAGDKFGEAYVNFYSKDGYWSDDKGSGNKGNNCMSKNRQMTKIGKTDIYYFDVSGSIDNWTWEQAFSFVNKSVEHDNFSMCNVVYRSDYNDRLPLYVPRYGWITDYFIECHYYNDGIWMKYNDTYSGYKLWIKEKNAQDATAQDVMLNALTPGGYEFNTTLNLKSGTTYELKIHNENGEWYGVTDKTITASSCTNWHFWKGDNNCQLTTSEAGDYTFVLNLGSGEVIISVEYPLSENDYRVVAKKDSEDKWVGDLIKNSGTTAKKDTTSFFNNHYTYQLQRYAGGDAWNNVGSEVTIVDAKAQEGVITLIVTQDGEGNATLTYEGIYTGNYYIRTDGVDGGWGDYENNSDNKMDNYGSLIQADPDYQYDVYKAKWITSGKNVKFRIANDYSKAISDELKDDDVIGTNKETLPQEANVRFMWNSTTNQLKRAYLSGSSNPSDRYLILEGDAKMFDKDGKALNITGLNDNELNFEDKNNWVYQADIQAKPGCEVKLTAKYNGKVQYFIGKEGDGDDSRRKIIDGSGTDKYNLRAVYDFKTNRLVVGWMPSGTITSSIELGSDMLIERAEQGDASQIVFGGSNPASLSISKIQHIYGVLKLTKATMISEAKTDYEKSIYWISFPFDVKVSEIFGVEKYGEVWVISNYRGDLRAQKGWFKEDTPTFWEYLKPTDIMKANVGYTLNLDPDYFNKATSEPWKSGAEEVAWYFPSMQENIGVVSLAQKDTTLLPQHCEIDREFNAGTEESPKMVNHKFTDSNWRVIGVPAFQNLQAPTFEPAPTPEQDKKTFGLTGFYEWQPSTNTYTAQSTSEYTFKATGAYMVQYEGKITWSNASAITTKNSAPWHASADSKSYSIKLEFGNEAYTDQTFVTLTEKASTDFVLNEDMMKLDNAGFPNIYSFAGNYNVAYNETKMDNQTVTLGVSAPKAGTYTFSMPKEFSGTAKLVDLVEGITTDLNISDYSVDLSKGTYNDRFQLVLEVEAKAPTSIENVECGWWNVDGKTLKLLRNGNIYLINAGRVYNAIGAQLR